MPVPKFLGIAKFHRWIVPSSFAVWVLGGSLLWAQDPGWRGGTVFNCRRQLDLPQVDQQPETVVVEFFTNGELDPDGSNLAVFDRVGTVPWRVLQTGPGDFCRLAIQTNPRQSNYHIYYGGEPSSKGDRPAWTQTQGLVLETWGWSPCDLNQLESIRLAFSRARPIGSDIVANVFHRADPFALTPGPFLSRYAGSLRIARAGKYKFHTSSQDASFLLIDGKVVVSAPGQHGPVGDARFSGEVELTTGQHVFEYIHAAASNDACMVAAWQPPGAAKPEVIPGESFGFDRVRHLPAGHLQHRTKGTLPDFSSESVGEVPLVDSNDSLIRVQFTDIAVKAVSLGARVRWEFGDGQTAESLNPQHVYLRPGIYPVTMTMRRGTKSLSTTNRVAISRPLIHGDTKQAVDQLDDYVSTLESYDVAKLDGPSAVQIVRAYEQARKYSEAAKAGQVTLDSDLTNFKDTDIYTLARLVGSILRDRLDDPTAALQVWRRAEGALEQRDLKAACLIEAAELCVGELLQYALAKSLLEQAQPMLEGNEVPGLSGTLHRLWGDWHAADGDGKLARAAYVRADLAAGATHNSAEQNARRGAHSRSVEAFLRTNELDRGRDELRLWLAEFPSDQIDGYRPLLEAQYLMASRRFAQAIRVSQNLLTVNPSSPYADQHALLSAQCEEKLGHTSRAAAAYHHLLSNYPGSPLVDTARQALSRLQKP